MAIQKNSDGSYNVDADSMRTLTDIAKERQAAAQSKAQGPFTDDDTPEDMLSKAGTAEFERWIRKTSQKARDWKARQ